MRVTDKHVLFFSYKDWPSNHYYSPFRMASTIGSDGPIFKTIEHYMMYEKAILFGDDYIAKKILMAKNPNDAKRLGREVTGYDNDVWSDVRENIVTKGLIAKMHQNHTIREEAVRLRKKDLSFVEASPYDPIWGIKMGEEHPDVNNPSKWKGLNLLGKCWDKAIDVVLEEDTYE